MSVQKIIDEHLSPEQAKQLKSIMFGVDTKGGARMVATSQGVSRALKKDMVRVLCEDLGIEEPECLGGECDEGDEEDV
jgi:hypothetical protein